MSEINWEDDTTRRYITGAVARPQPGDPRRCFYIDPAHRDEHGVIPMLVTEGEPGYRPMIGDTPEGTWYWGADEVDADEIAAKVNEELFGLTLADTVAIVGSSIAAQDAEDTAPAGDPW